ncbi:MAG: hypothetical protein OEY01_03950 [Desulfobulbaceae bacterium]|nr:hypothetical protein [Desulfobulbaceae bacterium]HIJ78337.1 hypothetical protein [Deltaproteobacteria bacterium]
MNRFQREGLLIGFRKEKMALPTGHYLPYNHRKETPSAKEQRLEVIKTMSQNLHGWLTRVF